MRSSVTQTPASASRANETWRKIFFPGTNVHLFATRMSSAAALKTPACLLQARHGEFLRVTFPHGCCLCSVANTEAIHVSCHCGDIVFARRGVAVARAASASGEAIRVSGQLPI